MSLNPLIDSRDVRFTLFEMLEIEKLNRFDAFKDYDRTCLLYTSDAADDLLCVDLGGRRIIKKKK